MVTLRFSTTSGVFSRLIRWVTWSDYSHVDFVLEDGTLLGSDSNGGVKIREHDPSKKSKDFVVDAPYSVVERAMTQLGKKYDWKGIVGMGLRKRIESKNKWFCSELIAWAFEQEGYPIVSTEKHWRIAPRDLLLSPLLVEVKE